MGNNHLEGFVDDVNTEDVALVKAMIFGPSGVYDPSEDERKDKEGSTVESESRQPKDLFDEFEGDIIEKEYPPAYWALLPDKSTRLKNSINIMTKNTVGLGWDVVSTIEIDEEFTPEETKLEVKRQASSVERLLKRPNAKQSFTELMVLSKIDEESTGDGYLEITRDDIGRINGLFWAPAKSVRRTKPPRDGYVQLREYGQRITYFKEFGDERRIDKTTGYEFVDDDDEEYIKKNIASEILHFKVETITSTVYGNPRHVSCTPAIIGNYYVDLRNVSLFENEAVPKFAVIVEGGELHPKSHRALRDFWNSETKGVRKSGRTILLQANMRGGQTFGKENQVRIKLEPLTLGITEDASYQNYKTANNDEIREAFGISEVFFTLAKINRASGDVGRQITNEQTFEPEARKREYQLNSIVRDLVSTKFNVPVLEADKKGIELRNEFINKDNKTFGFIGPYITKSKDPIILFIEEVEKNHCRFVKKQNTDLVFEIEPLVKIKFNRSTTQDLVNQAMVDEKYAKWGALTPNDLRKKIGEQPFPDLPEYGWAKYPLPMAVVMANRGEILWAETGNGNGGEDNEKPVSDEPLPPEETVEEPEGGELGEPGTKSSPSNELRDLLLKNGMHELAETVQ